ncbi:RNB domain-containing ribonuclease [Janibacter sp. DB-40]|uniref:RNB domain-containing ribonuclease n=1 Tax=Janibacter sp. DB-40 TaxID=3028808 RepID=UPI002405ACAB|nr:RNB domain-containing ribonuclease [Janibacter sp. DB-40]
MGKRIGLLRPTDPATGEVVDAAGLRSRLDEIRAELEVPEDFPAEVITEAERVAAQPLSLPERDETDLPFLTIDPPGSMDLDQAMHLSRDGDGYRVRYAIAHLESFVEPGGAIDAEARRRGQTIYAPDERTPLHPPVLSEGAASLLPDELRPAYVWDIRLDARGEHTAAEIYPAMVRSVERLEYAEVQASIDAGTDDERLALLQEIGDKRITLEQERGGASLPMPDQEVEQVDGGFRLQLRPLLRAEDWNAQISLLTGMVAAEMMLHADVGILRTMPEPGEDALRQLRQIASALQIPWPAEQTHGDLLRSLDGSNARHLALIHESTVLFRGAGYTVFDGGVPELVEQAAIAAPYAHVTAPLRRLVDRFGLALCAAVSAGEEVPTWVRQALPTLPGLMEASERLVGGVERGAMDAIEAATLADRVGQTFTAVVIDVPEGEGEMEIQVIDPPVIGRASGRAGLGDKVTVRLTAVDHARGKASFAVG